MLSNQNRILYVGVKNDLVRRLIEHRSGTGSKFRKLHGLTELVWFDTNNDICAALERERQIKSWNRRRKRELIDSQNPDWSDLSPEFILGSLYSALLRS
ncbi:MAG: GIY-YIG nuclease family protein [Dehalococcoidia bacterium]|nr:GIY-YIG nuclease family protein [Dehalococcoidia bacterium]